LIDVTAPPYSARGDGVTDDAAAVQAALDQGGHVYFPGGTYRIVGQPLRIKERTRLELAPDATIMNATTTHLLRNRWPDDNFPSYSGRGQILVEGGTWDMQATAGGAIATTPATALMFAHADQLTIRDTRVLNVVGAHGIDLMGCRGVRITDVTFAGFLALANDTQPREAIQIDGCYAPQSGDCAPIDATPNDDVLICGCRFQASADLPAPQRAVGSHGYADLVTGHEPRHIRVVDCTMDGCTDNAIHAWHWYESQIRGNTVIRAGKNGIVVQSGCRDVDVQGNQVYDSAQSGIWVNDTCDNIAVRGNRVIGSSRSADNTHYGIRVSSGCSTCTVVANAVRRRGGGVPDAKFGLSFGDGQRMLHFGNLLIWSGVTGALQDLSTSPITSAADAT
jgi:hypothetical protein